jgi:hypothetical protein
MRKKVLTPIRRILLLKLEIFHNIVKASGHA